MIATRQNQSKIVPTLTWLGGGLLMLAALVVLFVPIVERCAYLESYVPIKAWCIPMETLAGYRDVWYEYLVSVAAVGIGLLLFINEGKQKAQRRFDLRWLVVGTTLIVLLIDRVLGIFYVPGAICLLLAIIAEYWLSPRRKRISR
ncbi:MAG: hypothetical protein MUC85_12945 [Anaerolineales bacterium]|jgi:hypothetical protein|nr:hypothetical protein [Anaerolineales bacterium]